MNNMLPFFIWGSNGEMQTPEDARNRLDVAKGLMAQATDMSPSAGGWASVLNKGLSGYVGARHEEAANNFLDNEDNRIDLSNIFGKIFTMGGR